MFSHIQLQNHHNGHLLGRFSTRLPSILRYCCLLCSEERLNSWWCPLFSFPFHHSWSSWPYSAYNKSIISYSFLPTPFSSFTLQLMILLKFCLLPRFLVSTITKFYCVWSIDPKPFLDPLGQLCPFCIIHYDPKALNNPLTACPVSSLSPFSSLLPSTQFLWQVEHSSWCHAQLEISLALNLIHASRVNWDLSPESHHNNLPWVTWNKLKAFSWWCPLPANPLSFLSFLFSLPITLSALWHGIKAFTLALVKYLGHQQ